MVRPMRSRLLEGVADYAGLPPAYMLDLTDHEAQESAEHSWTSVQHLLTLVPIPSRHAQSGMCPPLRCARIAQSLRSIPSR